MNEEWGLNANRHLARSVTCEAVICEVLLCFVFFRSNSQLELSDLKKGQTNLQFQYRGQIKSFNNDIFATRGTRCLDFILVCFHQPPSAPSIFCFLTDLAWLTIYRGRCRGSVKTQVGLSALWRRNFAHNDCPRYTVVGYQNSFRVCYLVLNTKI